MISNQVINSLLEEKLNGSELYLVEAKVKPGNNIEVVIDRKKEHLHISDCVEISRFIESNLDREKEDYKLEVLSPGLDEPFKVNQQYLKNIGKEIEVITFDGQKRNGLLVEKNDESIVLETEKKDKKTKQVIREKISIPSIEIKQAKKTISFKF